MQTTPKDLTAAQMFKQLQDDCLAGRIGSSIEFYARSMAARKQYEAETRERHKQELKKSHNPKSCLFCQEEARAEQDYETPLEFMRAVTSRFGSLSWDLAASGKNHRVFSIEG